MERKKTTTVFPKCCKLSAHNLFLFMFLFFQFRLAINSIVIAVDCNVMLKHGDIHIEMLHCHLFECRMSRFICITECVCCVYINIVQSKSGAMYIVIEKFGVLTTFIDIVSFNVEYHRITEKGCPYSHKYNTISIYHIHSTVCNFFSLLFFRGGMTICKRCIFFFWDVFVLD